MVNVKAPGATTGSPAWPSLNVFNHVVAPSGVTAAAFEEMRTRYCEWVASNQVCVCVCVCVCPRVAAWPVAGRSTRAGKRVAD